MPLENLSDPHDIARALTTGYPQPEKEEECVLCHGTAECYDPDTERYLCFDCARKAFENMDDEDAVELLGYEVL